jgi:hypothetical protein
MSVFGKDAGAGAGAGAELQEVEGVDVYVGRSSRTKAGRIIRELLSIRHQVQQEELKRDFDVSTID